MFVGPHSYCSDEAYRMTSVGKEIVGVQTKIDKPDEDGNGEVIWAFRGVIAREFYLLLYFLALWTILLLSSDFIQST